jgi:hypothetical protein
MSSWGTQSVYADPTTAAGAAVSERVAFIRRTYGHLVGAILAFVGLEMLLFETGLAYEIAGFAFGAPLGYLVIFLLFMLTGWIGERWARTGATPGMQYLGLGTCVVAEAVIFAPLLVYASAFSGPELIPAAAVTTVCAFAGLSIVVFTTRKDFSFLGPVLGILSLVGLGVIIASWIFGLGGLGLWIAVGLALLVSGYVLYYTSKVLYHYRTDQHVAASLALFSSIATMFWYIIQIFMHLQRD